MIERPRSRPSWTPSASERAVLFGLSEGGPAAIVFAATRPERTRALILNGTFAYSGVDGWDDLDRDPAELRARLVPELGEDYTPSTEQLARWQELGRAARSAWGSGAACKALLPSVRSIRQLAMLERMSASPGMARATLEAVFRIDVRPILPTITAPTLVIHARDDPVVPVQCGRYLADHIPGARLLEVDGSGPRALVHRSRQDPDRDRGVPHRQPCRTVAVTSRPAHRVVHRHGRVDATRRGDRRRAVACGAAALW